MEEGCGQRLEGWKVGRLEGRMIMFASAELRNKIGMVFLRWAPASVVNDAASFGDVLPNVLQSLVKAMALSVE